MLELWVCVKYVRTAIRINRACDRVGQRALRLDIAPVIVGCLHKNVNEQWKG
jgi:hypothetical protein